MRLKRILWITLAVASIAAAQQDPPGRVGRLNFMTGNVSFQPGGVDDWVPANPNRPLTTGDQLWVDQNSRAEVHVASTAIRLNSSTAFQFLNLDDQNVQIRLAQGSIVVRVRNLDENQTFEVDTPNLAFSVLRAGEYRIDANPDAQSTFVTVRSGQGEGTGGGQSFPLRPREQAQVNGDQQVTFNVGPAPGYDWFDNWADGRDRGEDMSQSARYCSRDMIGYADLDGAGSWRPDNDYGNVWYPRAVPAGWAPYHYGHWAWIDPWGWTWVDDEPWGFAPFHYGRWAFIGNSWGWIPGPVAVRPVYAPALVAFVGGSHFNVAIGLGGAIGAGVAWFALGPHEAYVPAYNASPTYINRVNVTNTVIVNNNVNITNINNVRYVNQQVPNAVMAVSRDTFVNARPVAQGAVAVRPEMLRQAEVVRNAPVAPTQQAVLGRSLVGGGAVRPPAAIMTRQVVTRAMPPAQPVPFAQRQQLLQQNPGRPLAPAQVQQIRAQSPQPARQIFRPAPPAPAVNASQPQNRPGNPQPVIARPQPANVPPNQPQRQAEPPRQVAQPPAQPQTQERVVRPAPQPPPAQPPPQVRPAQPPPQERPAARPPQPPPQERQVQPPPQERPVQPPPQARPVQPPPQERPAARPPQPPPQERQVQPPPQERPQARPVQPPPQERPAERPAARPPQPPPQERQVNRPQPPPQPPPKESKPKQEKKEEKEK